MADRAEMWSRLWEVLGKPVLIAVLVACLLQLGWRPGEAALGAAGVTHFSALSVAGDAAIGGDLTTAGSVTVTGALAVAGPVSDGSGAVRLDDDALITGTLGVTGLLSPAQGVNVTGGVTATGGLTIGVTTAGASGAWLRLLGSELAQRPAVNGSAWSITQTVNWCNWSDAETYYSLAAAPAAGLSCLVCQLANATLVITDTDYAALTGTLTLDQNDCLTLMSDASLTWHQVSFARN